MHLKNAWINVLMLMKETHFLKLNCGELWSIKTSLDVYRILEFTFRNISLDKVSGFRLIGVPGKVILRQKTLAQRWKNHWGC